MTPDDLGADDVELDVLVGAANVTRAVSDTGACCATRPMCTQVQPPCIDKASFTCSQGSEMAVPSGRKPIDINDA